MTKLFYVTKGFNNPVLVDKKTKEFYEFDGRIWRKNYGGKLTNSQLKYLIFVGEIKG
jgi:hypothetical protein